MTDTNLKPTATQSVQKLPPYQAGKPIDELAREIGFAVDDIVKLASNENPLGLSDKVKEALSESFDDLSRYPNANGYDLKQALAEKYDVEASQITLGNGSNDLLDIVARTYVTANDEVIFAEHAFVVYPIVTKIIGAKAVVVPAKDYGHDLDAMLAAVTAKTKLVFIANPNNPTGTFLSQDDLEDFLDELPSNIIVVLDEAYFEYADIIARGNAIEWLKQYPNLIVSRTFSKAYGLAGLRIGYSLSSSDVAELLNRVRQPFNCSVLALKAATTILLDERYLLDSVCLNNRGMKDLTAFFERHNLEFIPSMGNFITVNVGQSGDDVYQDLLKEGVIVRPITGYGLPNHLRISIGTEKENQRFKGALIKVLEL